MKKILLLLSVVLSGTVAFSQQELIINGGFEQGETGWDFTYADSAFATYGLCQANGGTNYLYFGDYWEETGAPGMIDAVGQAVVLPSNMSAGTFSCFVSATSDEQDDVNVYDVMTAEVYDGLGNVIYTNSISNINCDVTATAADCAGWGSMTFNIPTQYAGQVLAIIFTSDQDGSLGTIFRVDDVSVLVSTSVGIEDLNQAKLAFFPNPTQGILTVENPSSEKQAMRISNELGQVVRYEMLGSGKNVIDLTSLSNGVYFIQLGDSKVEKLIVN
jgi:hypothetical protein